MSLPSEEMGCGRCGAFPLSFRPLYLIVREPNKQASSKPPLSFRLVGWVWFLGCMAAIAAQGRGFLGGLGFSAFSAFTPRGQCLCSLRCAFDWLFGTT